MELDLVLLAEASYQYSEGDVLPSGTSFLKGIVVFFTAIRIINTYRALTFDRGNTDGMRIVISWVINMVVIMIVFSNFFTDGSADNAPKKNNPSGSIEYKIDDKA